MGEVGRIFVVISEEFKSLVSLSKFCTRAKQAITISAASGKQRCID